MPSPKFHDHVVMLPVEVSVKVTVSGAVPEVGLALKPAVGTVGGEGIVALTWFENPLQVVFPLL